MKVNFINVAPFYVGQKVIGSDWVHPKSMIKKGHPYIITSCNCRINPVNGLGPFWYVGVNQHGSHNWLSPRLFTAIQEIPLMTFTEIKEVEQFEVLINN